MKKEIGKRKVGLLIVLLALFVVFAMLIGCAGTGEAPRSVTRPNQDPDRQVRDLERDDFQVTRMSFAGMTMVSGQRLTVGGNRMVIPMPPVDDIGDIFGGEGTFDEEAWDAYYEALEAFFETLSAMDAGTAVIMQFMQLVTFPNAVAAQQQYDMAREMLDGEGEIEMPFDFDMEEFGLWISGSVVSSWGTMTTTLGDFLGIWGWDDNGSW